jgi:hypothetical protein
MVVIGAAFCQFSGREGLCMHPALERGAPREERQKVALGSLTDWDAAGVFLEAVRCGSFRSAAERLDLSINGVRRRIDECPQNSRGLRTNSSILANSKRYIRVKP